MVVRQTLIGLNPTSVRMLYQLTSIAPPNIRRTSLRIDTAKLHPDSRHTKLTKYELLIALEVEEPKRIRESS